MVQPVVKSIDNFIKEGDIRVFRFNIKMSFVENTD